MSQERAVDGILCLALDAARPIVDGRYYPGTADAFRQLLAQVHPSAFHVDPVSRFAEVVGDKLRMQENISVQFDDVVARAACHTLVAHHRQPEALVFMPDMNQREGSLLLQCLNQLCGLFRRAVIAHKDLVG